jgi:hypothetical protein
MDTKERAGVLSQPADRTCIAYELRPDGGMVTPSRWSRLPFYRLGLSAAAALAAAFPMLFSSCSSSRRMIAGGIPPPTSEKDDVKSKDRYEKIASGKSSGLGGDEYYGYRDNLYDDVCRSFAKYGLDVDSSNVDLHKGLFENTMPNAKMERMAFAHIDCDWYDPVMYCLNKVADRLSQNGVILIDDYHDYGGCRTATDEFLRQRGDFTFDDGENVILRRTGTIA